MRKSNVLCKSLSTVESLGAVDIIASDKTGTLTQNKMTVVNISIGNKSHMAADARDIVLKGGPEAQSIKSLAGIAALCNDAAFDDHDDDYELELRTINGDATGAWSYLFLRRSTLKPGKDTGLLRFSEEILSSRDLRAHWREVGKIAFNSSKSSICSGVYKLTSAIRRE